MDQNSNLLTVLHLPLVAKLDIDPFCSSSSLACWCSFSQITPGALHIRMIFGHCEPKAILLPLDISEAVVLCIFRTYPNPVSCLILGV